MAFRSGSRRCLTITTRNRDHVGEQVARKAKKSGVALTGPRRSSHDDKADKLPSANVAIGDMKFPD
jgi:hypothetical protein